jgi:putative peptidoglycan lipid II flippase
MTESEVSDQAREQGVRRSGLLRSALGMSGITMGSRVLGLVREQVRAHFLGTTFASDAFGIAFQIPNLLRRLVAEGAMSSAFIPIFAEEKELRGEAEAFAFARKFFNLSLLALTLLSTLGVLGAGLIVSCFAIIGGRPVAPEAQELTTSLTRLMFPYIALVSWAAIAQGILNTYRIFWVSALTSVLLNLSIIGAAVLLATSFSDPSFGFAIGVVVGGALQLLFQVPFVFRLGFHWRPDFSMGPAVRRALWLLVPTLFGAGVYQINVLISQAIAWGLGAGAVSSLQYSQRLLELTLGVFAVAISTVALPSLASDAALNAKDRVTDTLLYSVRLCCFVCFPVTAAFLLLGRETASLLFERGAFGVVSSSTTSFAIGFHILALTHIALARVLVPVYYAYKDTRTPVAIAFVAMVVNITLCYALAPSFDLSGIALANSLSALVQALLLGLFLRKHLGTIEDKETGLSLLKSFFATTAMALAVFATSNYLNLSSLNGFQELALPYSMVVLVGCVVYLVSCTALKHGELSEFRQLLTRRRT